MRLTVLISSLLLLVGCEGDIAPNENNPNNRPTDGVELRVSTSVESIEVSTSDRSVETPEFEILEKNGYTIKVRSTPSSKTSQSRGAIYTRAEQPDTYGAFTYHHNNPGVRMDNVACYNRDIEIPRSHGDLFVATPDLRFPYSGLLNIYTYGPKDNDPGASGAITNKTVNLAGKDYFLGYPSINYTPASGSTKQCVDVIVSERLDVNNGVTDPESGLSLSYSHALVRIGFEIHNVDAQIAEFKIINPGVDGDSRRLMLSGDYSFGTNVWTNPKSWGEFAINTRVGLYPEGGIFSEHRLFNDGLANDSNLKGHYLLVLPQDFKPEVELYVRLTNNRVRRAKLGLYPKVKFLAGMSYTFVVVM